VKQPPNCRRTLRDERSSAAFGLGAGFGAAERIFIILGTVVVLLRSGVRRDMSVTGNLDRPDRWHCSARCRGLGTLGLSVYAFLRRSRQEAREAKRLNALLDVLDRRCRGLQRDAGHRVNTSFCRLIGVAREDAQHLMISSFISEADVIERLLARTNCGSIPGHHQPRRRHHRGRDRPPRTIPYGDGTARLLEFRDVGERKHTQQRVSFLAHHDPLTSLPNRELMRARLAEAVEKSTTTANAAR